jgi:2-polyprenyl-6-methoxyphenol hydroxylase-like FAD-dependent oxidoreductase
MLPFLGQGACSALEDAVALGAAMGVAADVESGIATYEGRRVERAGKLQRGSRLAARVALAPRGLRGARVRLLGSIPDQKRLERLDAIIGTG